jgi:HK97 family phage prohead protease
MSTILAKDEITTLRALLTGKAASRLKYAAADLKTVPSDGTGEFTAIVSTFGPPADSQGDVIADGAFDKSIADWRARGRYPAVWWSHGTEDPANAIGIVTSLQTTKAGLLVSGRLAIDESDRARIVYEGMLGGRITEFSIGYAVVKEHKDKAAGYKVLDEVELLEISIVWAGANRFTQLLEVKGLKDQPRNERGRWAAELADLNQRLDQIEARVPSGDVVDAFVAWSREQDRAEAEAERILHHADAGDVETTPVPRLDPHTMCEVGPGSYADQDARRREAGEQAFLDVRRIGCGNRNLVGHESNAPGDLASGEVPTIPRPARGASARES